MSITCLHVLSTLTGDDSARSSLALASVVIKLNHTRAKNINLQSDLLDDIQEVFLVGTPAARRGRGRIGQVGKGGPADTTELLPSRRRIGYDLMRVHPARPTVPERPARNAARFFGDHLKLKQSGVGRLR